MSSRLALGVVAVVAIIAIAVVVIQPSQYPMVFPSSDVFSQQDLVGQAAGICPDPSHGSSARVFFDEERMYYTAPYTAAADAGDAIMADLEPKLPTLVDQAFRKAESTCIFGGVCSPTVNYVPTSVTCTFIRGTSNYYSKTLTVSAPEHTRIQCNTNVYLRDVPSFQRYGLGFLASWGGAQSIVLTADVQAGVALPCSEGEEGAEVKFSSKNG